MDDTCTRIVKQIRIMGNVILPWFNPTDRMISRLAYGGDDLLSLGFVFYSKFSNCIIL